MQGKIGLRVFLLKRNVPTVPIPIYPCGLGEEIAQHLVTDCLQLDDAHEHLPQRCRTDRDVRQAFSNPEYANCIMRWLLQVGQLPEYRAAMEIERDNISQSWYCTAQPAPHGWATRHCPDVVASLRTPTPSHIQHFPSPHLTVVAIASRRQNHDRPLI